MSLPFFYNSWFPNNYKLENPPEKFRHTIFGRSHGALGIRCTWQTSLGQGIGNQLANCVLGNWLRACRVWVYYNLIFTARVWVNWFPGTKRFWCDVPTEFLGGNEFIMKFSWENKVSGVWLASSYLLTPLRGSKWNPLFYFTILEITASNGRVTASRSRHSDLAETLVRWPLRSNSWTPHIYHWSRVILTIFPDQCFRYDAILTQSLVHLTQWSPE